MASIPSAPGPPEMPGGFDPQRRYTSEEYFEICERTQERLEMYDGYIRVKDWDPVRMMAGGSVRHARLGDNVTSALRSRARGRGCDVFGRDVRTPAPGRGTWVYPDAVYVCGPEWIREESATLANPSLIVEVLSPSTQNFDRTDKFKLYAALPSIRAILLVASDHVSVEVYERRGEHIWLRTDVQGRSGILRLEELDLTLPLEEIYERVEVTDEPPPPPVAIRPL